MPTVPPNPGMTPTTRPTPTPAKHQHQVRRLEDGEEGLEGRIKHWCGFPAFRSRRHCRGSVGIHSHWDGSKGVD